MKDKIIQQDDHIILPKATLKRFSDRNGSMYALSLNNPEDLTLIRRFPRSFHTQKGFYDIDVDNKVKRIETSIGKWNKKLLSAIQGNDFTQIDLKELKEFAIQLITLQFHRCVMVDDNKRNTFFKKRICELDKRIEECFLTGNANVKKFINKKNDMISKTNTQKKSIRYFQLNYLLNENQAIKSSYEHFKAVILYIPDDSDYSFILPPSHFIGIDTVARVVINPRLAIGLYPYEITTPNIYKISRGEAELLIPRTIESALEMPIGFKEIIGIEPYLKHIDDKIKSIRKMCNKKGDHIVVSSNYYYIDNNNCFEFFMILIFLFPETKKIVINDESFKSSSDISSIQWDDIKKYGFDISIISSTINNSSFAFNVFLTEEDALKK